MAVMPRKFLDGGAAMASNRDLRVTTRSFSQTASRIELEAAGVGRTESGRVAIRSVLSDMADFRKADSKAVANALSWHRHEISARFPHAATIPDYSVERCTITYESLRVAAGMGEIARGVGVHLRKVSEWYALRDFRPPDSFVVRNQERDPVMVMTKPRKAAGTGAKMFAGVLFFRAILKLFHDPWIGDDARGRKWRRPSGPDGRTHSKPEIRKHAGYCNRVTAFDAPILG
jgi:hypothetical protein